MNTLFPIRIPKFHSLTGRIDMALALKAFQAVKRNRGAAGVDRVSIDLFEANLVDNLTKLVRSLKDGSFRPLPLRRKHIYKEPGKTRPLGIPTVKDRVAQEILRRLLDPIFDSLFHPHSFGFRAGRNCHLAIEKAIEFHEHSGLLWVLDADISGFFDNIPHSVIMDALSAQVSDGNILDIVESFLKAGVLEDGAFSPTRQGTPQGGVISPLLANIVLNHLDWVLHNNGYSFVRYADDFVVIGPTQPAVAEAKDLVQRTLANLGLSLSPNKTKITTYGKGYAFLGFILSSRSKRIRSKSEEKFKNKIRELTQRSRNLDSTVIRDINRVIRGTAQYFVTDFFTSYEKLHKLDSWIRMRLRAMKYKRKSYNDNRRFPILRFKKLGLMELESFKRTKSHV